MDRCTLDLVFGELLLRLHMDMQMSYAAQSQLVGALDADNVMSRFLELVPGERIAIRSVFYGVSIRLNGYRRTAITEVPALLAVGGTEGPYFKSHRRTDANSRSWPVVGMDRRR